MNLFYDRYRKMGLDGGGMDDTSIDAFEKHLGLPIPDAYRAYLRIAGSREPSALVGSECTAGRVHHLTESVRCDNSGYDVLIPDNAIVFFMHQGYIFYYFLADGVTDDPAVYFYHESISETEVRQLNDRFSDWVYTHAITRRP
jgi:hypothetical protein